MKVRDAITMVTNGVCIRLHVLPGSSEAVFPAGYNPWRNAIEIKVQAAAKAHQANNEVIRQVAVYLKVPTKDVIIVSGEKSKDKIILVKNSSDFLVRKQIEEGLHGL
jgi:hypothetical protein